MENSLKEAIWEGTAEYIQTKNTYLLKNGESIGFWRGTCYSIQNEKFIEYIDKRKCIEDKIEFSLPYEESKRNLIKFVKLDKTNNKYPRKFSEIKKKPL